MPRLLTLLRLFAAVALFLCLSLSAFSQQNPERLVLKDGSYQSVTKYEVKGDRVRYYSAERYTWEELPSSLVDWPATNKYNQDRLTSRSKELEGITKADEADAGETPIVAPGLRLPDGGGVFLLDTFQSEPQLIELNQASGELNKHTGKNILHAAVNPLALSSKETIEIKGDHAKTQAHVAQPVFYASIDAPPEEPKNASDALGNASGRGPGGTRSSAPTPAPSSGTKKGEPSPQDHYGIVRMEKSKDGRVIGNLNIAIYGKVSQKENWVKTVSTPLGPGWVKITPAEPLAPGEYALVEILDKGDVNLMVWDFGMNPGAPANPNAWTARKPESVQSGQQTGQQQPGLEKRPPN
jgi:hypothetical protein